MAPADQKNYPARLLLPGEHVIGRLWLEERQTGQRKVSQTKARLQDERHHVRTGARRSTKPCNTPDRGRLALTELFRTLFHYHSLG